MDNAEVSRKCDVRLITLFGYVVWHIISQYATNIRLREVNSLRDDKWPEPVVISLN